MNQALRDEVIAMRTEDLRVRQELVESGELGGHYVPRMEAVHIRNAQRLQQIIEESGWPDEQGVGEDGAKPRGSLFSMQSDSLIFSENVWPYCNVRRIKEPPRDGTPHIWKTE